MPFSQKTIASISEDDLLELIIAKEAESKEIDYKRLLPGRTDADRREFLYDLSSFANTSGGYLVFGMDEKKDYRLLFPGSLI
jgi:predicted HTH transcriptional regulator